MGVPAPSLSYIPPPPGESITPGDPRRLGATAATGRSLSRSPPGAPWGKAKAQGETPEAGLSVRKGGFQVPP